MQRRLPPLNALRAFEAAARHLSFTRAADELHVTQGAVSRQVIHLEEWLGHALFHRLHRGLALTDIGRKLLPVLTESFDKIGRSVERLRAARDDLKVKMLPTFAIRWFMPRSELFSIEHPSIQLRLTSSWFDVDFTREEFDCGIVLGHGPWPGNVATKIMSEILVPVCSPKLLNDPDLPLKTPEDLRQHTLLHCSKIDDWKLWFDRAGIENIELDRGLHFDTLDMALTAAAGGHGVAIGDPAMIVDDLKTNRLVIPFDLKVPGQGAYHLIVPRHLSDLPKIKLFRNWLLREAETSGVQ